MTSTDEAPRRLTDRKREAIMEAAIALFRSHGFAGTSMDNVAAAAAVSKRTVYNHFASKDELFAAMLQELFARSQAAMGEPFDAGQPLRPQLLALLGHKMRLLHDPRFMDLARVAVAEMMHTPDRARDIVARLSEKEEGLAVWIRAARQAGRLSRDVEPAPAAQLLEGLVKSQAFWPQLVMGQPALSRAQQQRVLNDAVDLFLARYEVASH